MSFLRDKVQRAMYRYLSDITIDDNALTFAENYLEYYRNSMSFFQGDESFDNFLDAED